MSWSGRTLSAALIIAGIALTARTGAAWVVTPAQPGQVGLGVQGQYGTMLKSGSLGSDFRSGPGLSVRLRYRMRYERGIGLSFESQAFDARVSSSADTAIKRLSLFTAGLEVYQMFGTRTATTKMVSVGAGLAKVSVKLNNDETVFPIGGDGVYVSGGAGIEHFFYKSWAYDFSGRYMTVFQDGKANQDFQLSLGVIFYSGY